MTALIAVIVAGLNSAVLVLLIFILNSLRTDTRAIFERFNHTATVDALQDLKQDVQAMRTEFKEELTQTKSDILALERRTGEMIQNALGRIEGKIDANEERNATTRHEMRNMINGLMLENEVRKRIEELQQSGKIPRLDK